MITENIQQYFCNAISGNEMSLSAADSCASSLSKKLFMELFSFSASTISDKEVLLQSCYEKRAHFAAPICPLELQPIRFFKVVIEDN